MRLLESRGVSLPVNDNPSTVLRVLTAQSEPAITFLTVNGGFGVYVQDDI